MPVPPVGQLNRAIIWPVIGKTKPKSRSPSSAPNPMTEYAGVSTRKYVLSTDPRAFQQYAAIEYHGRPLEIAPFSAAAKKIASFFDGPRVGPSDKARALVSDDR